MKNKELVGKFLEVSKIEKNLSERTLKAYRSDLKSFMDFFRTSLIESLDIEDLREYLSHLEKRNLKDSTIRRKLATIKVFFSFLDDEGLIDVSPAGKLKKKYRVIKRLPRVMSAKEVKMLLKATHYSTKQSKNGSKFNMRHFKCLRDRAMLELLFATGIRIDELVKLNVHDLDLYRRTLLICGKGRKERMLYISCDEVLYSIKEYLDYYKKRDSESKALFLNKFGQRLSVHSIGNVFKEYSQMAGISRRFTPHCLRHTMATMLIENGADVRSVQEILGHSRISTTEIYLSVSKRRKQEVLSRFNGRNQFQLLA